MQEDDRIGNDLGDSFNWPNREIRMLGILYAFTIVHCPQLWRFETHVAAGGGRANKGTIRLSYPESLSTEGWGMKGDCNCESVSTQKWFLHKDAIMAAFTVLLRVPPCWKLKPSNWMILPKRWWGQQETYTIQLFKTEMSDRSRLQLWIRLYTVSLVQRYKCDCSCNFYMCYTRLLVILSSSHQQNKPNQLALLHAS
jgi:hypothetical protein